MATDEELDTIYNTIQADPELKALTDVGADNACWVKMVEPDATMRAYRDIPIAEMVEWAVNHDVFTALEGLAGNTANRRERAAAKAALALLQGGVEAVPMTNIKVRRMMFLLADEIGEASGNGTVRRELNDLATFDGSIAESAEVQFLTVDDVSAAMLRDRPDGKIPVA